MTQQHRIVGRLTRDAHACAAQGGAYVVWLEMTQPEATHADANTPIVAACQMGFGTSAVVAANSKAYTLRKGTRVRVWCIGIGLGHTRDDEAAIRLFGVDMVEVIPAPATDAGTPSPRGLLTYRSTSA